MVLELVYIVIIDFGIGTETWLYITSFRQVVLFRYLGRIT